MGQDKLNEAIEGTFSIQTLIYMLSAQSWENLTNLEREEEVKKWATKARENLYRTLDKLGYTIVPKEIPAAFNV